MWRGTGNALATAVAVALAAVLVTVVLTGHDHATGGLTFVEPDASMQMSIAAGASVAARPVTGYHGRRGDVVVLRGVWGRPSDEVVIARVVAVGGETARCCDVSGRTLVDDSPLREGYLYFAPGQGTRQRAWPQVAVPPGALWVLGDNRNAAVDSRLPGNGPVPEDSVVAVLTGDAETCPPAAISCATVEKITNGHPHHVH